MTPYWNWTRSRIGWLAERTRVLARDAVERRIAEARLALAWERVWPALWPSSGILGLYLAAGLFGLFDLLWWEVHLALLLAVLGGMAVLLHRELKDFRFPSWEEGARRVERDSALAHGPITERNDTLAVGAHDSWSVALWREHMRQLLAGLGTLRVNWPSPGLPSRDRHALRFVVLATLVLGFAIAGTDSGRRLYDAFAPNLSGNGPPPTMDAWINPPAYTGQAPLYLQAGSDGAVRVPAGSELVVRVHGARTMPYLEIAPSPRGLPEFTGAQEEYGVKYKLRTGATVAVHGGGRELGRWAVAVTPDTPPRIAFAGPPAKTEQDALKLSFTARDDYGVAGVRALLTPVNPQFRQEKPFAVDLALPSNSAKTVSQTDYHDLTEHPLAGLVVDIVLEARDGAGQTARTRPVRFRLPARVFTHPLARALVEQRQYLALGGSAIRERVALTLDALTIAPDKFYENMGSTYTAIRGAYHALKYAQNRADVERVQAILWEAALALENGGALLAQQELRAVQQMLAQALAQGAPQEVIDALMQRYAQALQRYLDAMAKNAKPSNGPPPPGAKAITEEDLKALMDMIRKLAQSGANESAMQMLAMLQGLLENMQMSAGSGGGQSPQDQKTAKTIQDMGELMGRQRQLMDKTFREQQGNADPKEGGAKGLAQQQGKLREDMGKVLKDLGGKQPDAFGKSEREMGKAEGQLGAEALDEAGESERKALDAMREGTASLAEEMMKRSGQSGQGQSSNDPFGRQQGARGPNTGGGVKVPEESQLQRARSILEELRRRAAERGRPKEELDYIDRLLKQF